MNVIEIERELQKLTDDLRDEVHAFLQHASMFKSEFGRRAMNDPNFVFALDRGRQVTPKTVIKVQKFIRENYSADAAA